MELRVLVFKKKVFSLFTPPSLPLYGCKAHEYWAQAEGEVGMFSINGVYFSILVPYFATKDKPYYFFSSGTMKPMGRRSRLRGSLDCSSVNAVLIASSWARVASLMSF